MRAAGPWNTGRLLARVAGRLGRFGGSCPGPVLLVLARGDGGRCASRAGHACPTLRVPQDLMMRRLLDRVSSGQIAPCALQGPDGPFRWGPHCILVLRRVSRKFFPMRENGIFPVGAARPGTGAGAGGSLARRGFRSRTDRGPRPPRPATSSGVGSRGPQSPSLLEGTQRKRRAGRRSWRPARG